MHAHMHTNAFTQKCKCVHICICRCMYIYRYTHIFTFTYLRINKWSMFILFVNLIWELILGTLGWACSFSNRDKPCPWRMSGYYVYLFSTWKLKEKVFFCCFCLFSMLIPKIFFCALDTGSQVYFIWHSD